MTIPKLTISTVPSGEDRRSGTARKLLASAMELVRKGRVPSVPEVALHAGVSRATAYRHFSGRGKLVATIVAESLLPVRRYVPPGRDGKLRLQQLFVQTFPQFKEFEPHMRAALQFSLEHESMERAGLLEEEPYRRGFRRGLLRRAAAPLRREIGARAYDRLLKALSIIYGVEPYVVLKDIWGAKDQEVESIARWMLEALVDASLREAQAPNSPPSIRRRSTKS